MSYLIQCELCQSQLALAEPIFQRRVAGRKVTLRCKKCRAELEVDARNLDAEKYSTAPTIERRPTPQSFPAGVTVRTLRHDAASQKRQVPPLGEAAAVAAAAGASEGAPFRAAPFAGPEKRNRPPTLVNEGRSPAASKAAPFTLGTGGRSSAIAQHPQGSRAMPRLPTPPSVRQIPQPARALRSIGLPLDFSRTAPTKTAPTKKERAPALPIPPSAARVTGAGGAAAARQALVFGTAAKATHPIARPPPPATPQPLAPAAGILPPRSSTLDSRAGGMPPAVPRGIEIRSGVGNRPPPSGHRERTGTMVGICRESLPPLPSMERKSAEPGLVPRRARRGTLMGVAAEAPRPVAGLEKTPPWARDPDEDDDLGRDELPTEPRIAPPSEVENQEAFSKLASTLRPEAARERGIANPSEASDENPGRPGARFATMPKSEVQSAVDGASAIAPKMEAFPPPPPPPPILHTTANEAALLVPPAASGLPAPPHSVAARPDVETAIERNTGDAVDPRLPPEPAKVEAAAPSNPGREDGELTAPGYSRAADGVPSSSPTPAAATLRPRRRGGLRALLWTAALTITAAIAISATFVFVPAVRVWLWKVAPAQTLAAVTTGQTVLNRLGLTASLDLQELIPSRAEHKAATPKAVRTPNLPGAAAVSAEVQPRSDSGPGQNAMALANPADTATKSSADTDSEPTADSDDAASPISRQGESSGNDPSKAASPPPADAIPAGNVAAQGKQGDLANLDEEPAVPDTVPEGVDELVVRARFKSVLRRAARCHPFGHAVGTALVTVTFAPSGKVSHATLQGEPLASAPVGECVLAHARSVIIPRFNGEPFKLSESVTLN